MPGYADWEQLYKDEYDQLIHEGYLLKGAIIPEENAEELLPLPNQENVQITTEKEQFWENAYTKLWKTAVENGIRKDYRYEEPEILEEILSKGVNCPPMRPLKNEAYRKRLEGSILGRCVGIVLGKPLEMGLDRIQIRKYLESTEQYPLQDYVKGYSEKLKMELRKDCIPSTFGNVCYVQPDDDIHYTILSVLLVEKYGLDFTGEDIGNLWLDNIPYHWLWCSSRQAYYHFVNLKETDREEEIRKIPKLINPWRECIDGQIRSDLWGYLFPAEPEKAARIAYRDCSFSLVKNGVYGGMFIAGCIAAAFTEKPEVITILEGGLSVIPQGSRLAEAVEKVIGWYKAEPGNWMAICDKIYEDYGKLPFAATINNLAIVTLSLLHGNLDYTKTITTAVMCGIDTDCNAGTAGSIVGAAIGTEGIDEKWIKPLNNSIHSAVASFGEGRISGLTARIEKLHDKYAGIRP